MNQVTLLGRLTRDPEMRYSEQGVAITYFTIAVTRERDREKADFINCIAFGKIATALATHCQKGRQLLVTGRLEINIVKKEVDGVERTNSYTNIIAQRVEFLAKPRQEAIS